MGSWTTRPLVGPVAAFLFFAGAPGLHAQNILLNPGFTGGLSPWNTFSAPGYTVGWDPAQGNAAAGALSFDMPASPGTTEIYLAGQCVPATASTLYDVAGSFRYPASVGTVPRGGLVVQAFSDALCTLSMGSSGFGLSFAGSPADTWITQTYVKGYTSPANTVAIRMLLRVNTFAAGGVSGWFDDITVAPSPLAYFTLPPCRLVDTRDLGAPVGGPVMNGQETRTITASGNCGIPGTARALSLNVAVTQPTSGGNLRLFASDQARPTVSTINYSAGQTRTNNGIVGLAFPGGTLAAFVGQPVGTTVHLIVDVNGYFE
jgi:hypothetical protein